MSRLRFVVAFVTLATTQGPAFGQVAAQVLNNGQAALTVDPGPVSLKLDIRLSCTLPDIAAVQFALVSSNGASFAYATPPLAVGTPWGTDDLILPAEIKVGDLLSTKPDIIFLRLSGADPTSADFPATIVSYNVQSVGDLPAGATYVFSLGGAALPPVWARALPDGAVDSGDIDNTAVFTLTVAGSGGGGGGGGGGGTVTAPSVTAVQVQTGSSIDVTYSAAMGAGATTATNYTLSGNGKGTLASNPSSVALVSGNTYRLTWAAGEMKNGGIITVSVANVQDLAGTAIGSPSNGTQLAGGIGVAPTVSTVQVQTASTVDITFSEPMGDAVATVTNYTVSGSGKGTLADNPNSVAILVGNTYRLTWSAGAMVTGGDIAVAVADVQDLAGNPIGSPNTGTHTGGGIAPTNSGGTDQTDGNNTGGTDNTNGQTDQTPTTPVAASPCGAGVTTELMFATMAGLALLPRRRRQMQSPA